MMARIRPEGLRDEGRPQKVDRLRTREGGEVVRILPPGKHRTSFEKNRPAERQNDEGEDLSFPLEMNRHSFQNHGHQRYEDDG